MPPPAEGFAARFVLGPALRTQPDRRLVTLVREGYESAFEEIVRRYGRPLTRYAAAIVGGRAEDVTQDAFSKALLALRRDGAEIELRPWLFRIVRNTALNDLRDRPPSAAALAEAIAGGSNPAEELERREELADLMRRLQALPEPQRAAIVMRELEGLSHEEIAAALGLSGGAARQAIYRARRALRDGAGMLLPLPLLKALLAGAASAPVEAGAAGLGGAAGAGVALKAATATVLVAGAVGAGVAIDHSRVPRHPPPATGGVVAVDSGSTRAPGTAVESDGAGGNGQPPRSERGDRDGPGGGDDGHGSSEPGDDRGHHASSAGSDGNRGPGGHGGTRHTETGDDHGGDGSGSPGEGGSGGDGGSHSGHGSGGTSGRDGASSGEDGGSGGGSEVELGSSSGSGSGAGSGSEDESGSGGESGSSTEGGGPESDDSGDSHGGDGFSLQTQPPTQEEP